MAQKIPVQSEQVIKIAVYANGTLVKQYDVVIYGDINGDGKISVVDLVMMQKQILGTSQLSGAYAAAADISRDGKVSVKRPCAFAETYYKCSTD